MFVTFHSEAYENITYFNDVAKKLLVLMGHSGTVPGALKAEQVSDALANLQQGITAEKAATRNNNDDDDESEISLAKRAIPLIHLLEAAAKSGDDVLWETSRSPG